MHPAESCRVHYLQGVGKGSFGLAGKAHDDISCYRNIRYRIAQPSYQCLVLTGGILPVHTLQDLVITALQRNMRMPAETRIGQVLLYKFVIEMLCTLIEIGLVLYDTCNNHR